MIVTTTPAVEGRKIVALKVLFLGKQFPASILSRICFPALRI